MRNKSEKLKKMIYTFAVLALAVFGFVFSARDELQVAGRHL
jgi:hypothetical protein